MNHVPPRRRLLVGGIAVPLLLFALASPAAAQSMSPKKALKFAADMAQRGNWREAQYRWEELLRADPEDPRVLNNLAVTAEILGEVDQAREYYARVTALTADERIESNRRRFVRGLEDSGRSGEDEDGNGSFDDSPASASDKQKGKTISVNVGIPIPPRLKLDGGERLLVASFRAPESELLDINRDLVRFLRTEIRKNTSLEVLDVIPPPPIPEQLAEELVRNRAFWQHLSREHDAEVIVSGVVNFASEDASGYSNVDLINPTTRQKYRDMVYLEQERFEYRIDIFFVDGPTGILLFRDRIERSMVFKGSMNDPIAAFYELSDSIAGDVLAIVAPRHRVEPRLIFKN
jgi:hypothetical protein